MLIMTVHTVSTWERPFSLTDILQPMKNRYCVSIRSAYAVFFCLKKSRLKTDLRTDGSREYLWSQPTITTLQFFSIGIDNYLKIQWTIREIKHFDELEALVHEEYESTGLVEVKWYADDHCIKWNTYPATLDGNVVGYANHALENHPLAS